MTRQPLGKKKMSQPQKFTFWKEVPKNSKTYFYPNDYYDFALKKETSWAKKDVKPRLKTWNVNDVIVYVWCIYSQIKNIKKMKCKKEQF